MDDNKMMQAQMVYQMVCAALDARKWSYKKDDADRIVRFGVRGDDLPMELAIAVDAQRQLVRVMSPMPFEMAEEKRVEGAVAVCAATYGMVDGSFDYDVSKGVIAFRMTASYRESIIGEGMIHYLIDCTCAMMDRYNDRFLALNKGIMSLEDFMKKS